MAPLHKRLPGRQVLLRIANDLCFGTIKGQKVC
jgi:hypothetical protein